MERYTIIVAGGQGTRMGSETPKQFLLLRGKPILSYTLHKFEDTHIVLVLPKDQLEHWDQLKTQYEVSTPHKVVEGGATRYQSVSHGLRQVPREALVAVHDGVRPLVSKNLIDTAFYTAQKYGSAVPCVPLKESIREVHAEGSLSLPRERYRLIQTPQVFVASLLQDAFALGERPEFTDDASVYEYAGHSIHLIQGQYENIKITTPEDLPMAELLLLKESQA